MAGNSTVAAMTAADALTGAELFYTVQSGNDRKATATQIQTFIGSGITIGTTAITSGTDTRILFQDGSVVGQDADFAWNKTTNVLTAGGTLAITSAKAFAVTNSLTLSGTDSTTMTFPATSTTLAGLSIANVFTADQTISSAGLVLSGNISSAAWTTGGLRIRGVAATLTDTSSSGTVAAAYTNVLGGNTIAASSSTTFTNYYTTFISEPTAGSNVTFTNKWALGLTGNLSVSGLINLGTTTFLQSDAANALALRNSTTAQAFRVYNTYTDASNYERAFTRWASNILEIGVEVAGTGTSRAMQFMTAGTARWNITTAGHLIGVTDNTYDIGASGATRPRTIYLGTSVNVGGVTSISTTTMQTAAAGFLGFVTRSFITSPSDGVLFLQNNAGSDFGRLQFGGTTSSFPAIKRSSTVLQARLADDSAFAPLQGNLRTQANAVAETPTATHTMIITDAGGTAYRVLCVV